MLQIILYFILFFLTVIFGMPIAIALGLTGVLIASVQGIFNPVLLGHVMYQGVDHFSLLAVPFFMLAGTLMEAGGISRRLMEFSFALVGRMRGGLAQVAVVLSMLFAGLSGSAVADTAAVGSLLIPSMREKGYREGFAAALIAAGGAIGPIIPPSIPMVIYAVIANVSVAKLFLGGVIPGITFGLFLMAYSYYEALRHDYPRETSSFSFEKLLRTFQKGFLAFLMPVIILGGILSGIFTATESSVVAAVYAFLVGKFIYGELKWKDIPEVFCPSCSKYFLGNVHNSGCFISKLGSDKSADTSDHNEITVVCFKESPNHPDPVEYFHPFPRLLYRRSFYSRSNKSGSSSPDKNSGDRSYLFWSAPGS